MDNCIHEGTLVFWELATLTERGKGRNTLFRREPEMKGQIVKDEQEATTRRLIHALPMSDVILLNIPS